MSKKFPEYKKLDLSKINTDEVSFGVTVKVNDLGFDDEEEFTLVGAGEEDYDTGKILVTSPLAQGVCSSRSAKPNTSCSTVFLFLMTSSSAPTA